MFWLRGNLSGVRGADVWMAVSAAVGGCLTCFWHIRALDAFTFGIDRAASLGIAVRRVQVLLIGAAALTTAVMVSIVGSLRFVGLVLDRKSVVKGKSVSVHADRGGRRTVLQKHS